MSVSERIFKEVRRLPEPLQVEVLDFVQYLALRVKREFAAENELSWTSFSLSLAMKGMEDEDSPAYSVDDLREAFL